MAVSGAMKSSERRVVFGVNAIVQAVLALGLVIALVWMAGRLQWRSDLTSTGINSLSTRTEQLLRNLDQNVRITAIFPEPDKRDKIGEKRRREISQLLDLYDAVGGARVSTYLLDPSLPEQKAATDRLLKRLTELPAYKDEARPHEEALERFPGLNEQIRVLAGGDFARAEQLVQVDPQLGRNRNFAIVRNNLQHAQRESERIGQAYEDLRGAAEIPRYGEAVRKVRDHLNAMELLLRDAFGWMSGEALSIPGLTPELRALFEEAPSRYERVLADITALLDATKDLQKVKLEEVYAELTRWRSGPPILVESEWEVRVLSFWEVWPVPADPNAPVGPDGDEREFAGEATISSAILQLTQAEKTAVIFTRYGGGPLIRPDYSRMNQMMTQIPRAPFQKLSALLEKANFLTEEWDVSKQKTPPAVEGAARKVYVVFPPEPPPRPNPMQPSPHTGMTPEDRQIVLDAIEQSGMAVFLAGWAPPTMSFPGATGTYEYREYLRDTWGVEVESDFLAFGFAPDPQRAGWWVQAGREPRLLTTDKFVRLTNHPIARPSRSDRAGFFFIAPLRILEDHGWTAWFHHESGQASENESQTLQVEIELDLTVEKGGALALTLGWATDEWTMRTVTPAGQWPRPPLPEDVTNPALVDVYIGRHELGEFARSQRVVVDYTIDGCPEWVAINVQGAGFEITGGVIRHKCGEAQSEGDFSISRRGGEAQGQSSGYHEGQWYHYPRDAAPPGVTVQVLAQVRQTEDVWCTSNLHRLQEQYRENKGVHPIDGVSIDQLWDGHKGDVVPPFPIAVAGARGEEQKQKVVVFASEQFAADSIAQASGVRQVGDNLVLGPLHPANSDLLINSLHWLTGEADRIAVGPRRGELPRLKDLDEAWAARLPVLLVGVWPAVALAVGVGVWLIRRR